MTTYVQLHLLTSYPPANLNRDDLGRPKTARMGGVDRLRVSSQSLKRTWRTSSVFEEALVGGLGVRTRRMGTKIFEDLTKGGVSEKKAREWTRSIAEKFGKLSDKDGVLIQQLAHFGPAEREAIDELVKRLIEEKRAPDDAELALLRKQPGAADVALFGRMLADAPTFNVEAACQVAHALTVHRVTIEDDYFSAVDDLNEGAEDLGAGHIGETGFAAGLFYSYICVDRDRLLENLSEDRDLADRALAALVEAATTVAPTGKQNSFGSRAYASFVLAERGSRQPRSLSVAFLEPVDARLEPAIESLEGQVGFFDDTYGPCAEDRYRLDAVHGKGTLEELKAFVVSG